MVPTGAQAIAKSAEMHPDLVFIDIKLEGEINGIEATKHIRSSLDIPTIYIWLIIQTEYTCIVYRE